MSATNERSTHRPTTHAIATRRATTEALDDSEEERLDALRDYDILDTDPEVAFDDLAGLAVHITGAPIGLVSLLDADRQWFKAKVGVDVTELPRSISFCNHAIRQRGLMIVPDMTKDERFEHNPLVTGEHHVRFYAGAPLITEGGHALGTLCVVDREPREFSPSQQAALLALARQVVSQLELRRTAAANASLCIQAQRDAKRRQRQALRDPLTGLPNRTYLSAHLGRTLDRIEHSDGVASSAAILMIDLDRFKQVNDTLGHGVGDEMLRKVANVLRASVRTRHSSGSTRGNDVVARLGGDEFIVLLNDLNSPRDAEPIAERILDALQQPFDIEGQVVQIGASVGIVAIEKRHHNVDEVMREADTALYSAKNAGKGQFSVFDVAMHRANLREMRLERDLRAVFTAHPDSPDDAGFFLHYQPIVDVTSGKPVGFEALARWRHPELGNVSPVEFIHVAETTGLIIQLGAWVMAEACRQLAAWTKQHASLAAMTMNVNVARRQLMDRNLVPLVSALLERHQIKPSRLKIEITESSVMQDPEASAEAIERLRGLGCELYMDDFGTGHSSLGCLKGYALDGLKIDRSFVSGMAESANADSIVRAIMELSRCFNMKVTAEGVETSEQWWLLRKFGCQHAQGYFFSKPLEAHIAADYVMLAYEDQTGARVAA